MRLLIITLLAWACLSSQSSAPKVNIVVAIAEKEGVCTSSDVGFSMIYGETTLDKLQQKAISRVKRIHPGTDQVRLAYNLNKKKYKGNYVMIISGSSLNKQCLKGSYGVGFGKNRNQALEQAIKDLKKQNKHWEGEYKVVRDKEL